MIIRLGIKENYLVNTSFAVYHYNVPILLLLDGNIKIVMINLFNKSASAINYPSIWQSKILNRFDI